VRKHDRVQDLARQVADPAEAAFVVALDGTVVSWNTAAVELFGVPLRQALGAPCQAIVRGRTALGQPLCCMGCPPLETARTGHSAPPFDLTVPASRGLDQRRVRVHVVTLRDPDGQPQGVLHLVEDAEAQRRRERIGERYLALLPDRSEQERGPCTALTPREQEVLQLLAQGQTAREVAAGLGIRYSTARTHIQRILSKLGAHNRVTALASVLEGEGLGEPTFAAPGESSR
jgi:DNA-binding CsgD family transcriptional regulator